MGRRVLVTGVAGTLAGRLAARLAADERVEHVAGVDVREPRHDLGRTEVIRADLRHAGIARVIEAVRADTIVHLAITAAPGVAGGRSRMKELNVIGTMQLLAAAQKSPHLRRLVVKSTTAVYGSHHTDPALFREDIEPDGAPRSGYSKDAVEVEGYARGFARRRPDVATTTLRFANFVGPGVDSPLTRYVALPVVPVVLGFDARVQLIHVDDALDLLTQATLAAPAVGIFNVAGPGILYLSQAVRLAGRPAVPLPLPLVTGLGAALRRVRGLDFSPEQLQFLQYGRVGDLTRLREVLAFTPQYSTREAFLAHLESSDIPPLADRLTAARWERSLYDAYARTRAALQPREDRA